MYGEQAKRGYNVEIIAHSSKLSRFGATGSNYIYKTLTFTKYNV